MNTLSYICRWCKDHGITYGTFQKLETLGHIKVSHDKPVRIIVDEYTCSVLRKGYYD